MYMRGMSDHNLHPVYYFKNGNRYVQKLGCTEVNQAGRQHHRSNWVTFAENPEVKKPEYMGTAAAFMDGSVQVYVAKDLWGRTLVSNVCFSIGGMDDGFSIGWAFRELWRLFGGICAIKVKMESWWADGENCRRHSIGHPVYVQFSNADTAKKALDEWEHVYDRDDAGGNRTLKLEYCNREFQIRPGDVDEHTVRSSLGQGIEWFTRPRIMEEGTEKEFDAMNQPADTWPCNRNKARRDFGGGRGESNWHGGEKWRR